MQISSRYSVERTPGGKVVVECKPVDGQGLALILSPQQARTLATKLRNAAERVRDERG